LLYKDNTILFGHKKIINYPSRISKFSFLTSSKGLNIFIGYRPIES